MFSRIVKMARAVRKVAETIDVSRLIYANRRQEERMRQVMRILSTADTKANLTAWPVSILRDAVEDAITFIDPMAKQN